MKENNITEFLKPLDDIQKVETPPFLFTRIQQRILNETSSLVSIKTAYVFGASFLLLVLLNVYAITKIQSANFKKDNLVETFHIMPDNNLYQ